MPLYVEALLKLAGVMVGALIGGWLAAGLVGRLVSAAIRRPAPRIVLLPFRIIGAVAAGWLVWLLVIGPGGIGWGGGGPGWFGGGGAGTPSVSDERTDNVRVAVTKPQAVPPAPAIAGKKTLRVVLLGGSRVVGERFYLVEGNRDPETLPELKQTIKEKQRQSGGVTLELLIYENSVARNHPAVSALESWAEQNNLTVSLPPTHGAIP